MEAQKVAEERIRYLEPDVPALQTEELYLRARRSRLSKKPMHSTEMHTPSRRSQIAYLPAR